MTRSEILNEHLAVIYVLDEFDLSKIKSNFKQLISVASTGNILKANQEYSKLKDMGIDELSVVARKKLPEEYNKAKKYVDQKVKKDNKLKEPLLLARACLSQINKEIDDPEIKNKTQESLEELDDILKNMQKKGMVDKGITMILFAMIVSFFLGSTLYLAPILAASGLAFIAAAILIYIVRHILDLFITNKKEGKKVIK